METSARISDDERAFANNLYKEISKVVGEMSHHRINPKFVKFTSENRFIIRSSLEGAGALTAALALIKRINNTDVAFYTLKSSGTIRAVSQFKG